MPSELVVQYVRTCIAEQRFVVTNHARTKHTLTEGFTVRQGVGALLNGQVIEESLERNRLLFCGPGSGVALDPRFHTTYIRIAVEVDANTQVGVVTMYRPLISEWRTPWKRR